MKHIIWGNININLDDWQKDYQMFLDEEAVDKNISLEDWVNDTNWSYLEDEYINLDKRISKQIIAIADLGFWNGRTQGYKLLGDNLSNIFNINSRGIEYAEFYGDGYNIRAKEIHHDGTNYYLYRTLRPDRNTDTFLRKIYSGEEINRSTLNYYTKSLYKEIKNIYGWR